MGGWLDEDINYDLILQIIVESSFCISKMIIPHEIQKWELESCELYVETP